MHRQSLRIIIVLGVLVTLVGGTGIFAVFNDRATAGQNFAVTQPRDHAADLKIEALTGTPESGPIVCDADGDHNTFDRDDTTTPQIQAGPQPGSSHFGSFVCLRNVGSAQLVVTTSAIDIMDIDGVCSGDEVAWGDETCGVDAGGAPLAGELSAILTVAIDRVNCSNPSEVLRDGPEATLAEFSAMPLLGDTVPPLGPGEIACLSFMLTYPLETAEGDAQRAQSDQVNWRFAFDATAE